MEGLGFVGFVILWTSILGARAVLHKETQSLTVAEKAKLVDYSTKNRPFIWVVFIIYIGGYFVVQRLFPTDLRLILLCYGVLLLIWLVLRMFKAKKELEELDFPKAYIHKTVQAALLRMVGLLLSFACFLVEF